MSEAMDEPSDYHAGQLLLGKLEVIRRIGGGGMGVVYEVEHRLTGHRRALKVVRPQYADRPRFMKRLLREAKVAGTLGTEHVVETYDAGRLEDGSAYIVMELLAGRSLFETMEAVGPIEPRRLASIMIQVAEGMSVAHGAGIVHRDLKPENIFLMVDDNGDERAKILDFGVSKFELDEQPATRLTAEGTLVGTPYYMSPEQAAGRVIDARTDVYAMGVMMYEALAGKLPFEAGTIGELFVRIGAGECVPLAIRRPDLEGPWADAVHKAFHRDAAQRYQSSEALRRDLLPLAAGSAAKRARTISDGGGARGTQDYGDEPLPAPPKVPHETLIDESVASQDDAGSAVPAPSPQAAPKPVSGWAWAAGAAALVLAGFAVWQLLNEPSGVAEPRTAPVAERTAPVEEPRPDPSPSTEPAAPVIAEATPDASAPELPQEPRVRGTSPAATHGLDPNPYR